MVKKAKKVGRPKTKTIRYSRRIPYIEGLRCKKCGQEFKTKGALKSHLYYCVLKDRELERMIEKMVDEWVEEAQQKG